MVGNFQINKWLLPLSWLYGLGVTVRNKLFDGRILPSEEFPVPVISIGNLTIGGTGKTPHTEYLIRLLSSNYRVAVLSRGYKRKSKGYVLAGENASCQSIGDEPFQMFRKFPQILVAVDGDRRRGIRQLLALSEEQRPQIVLLDDAFQHRYVKPSLSILLTDYNRLFSEDALLPAGRLREPQNQKKRAQIVVVTKCPDSFSSEEFSLIQKKLDLFPEQELFATSYQYKGLLPVFPENNPVKKENLDRLKKEAYSLLLIAGIANPDPLIRYVKSYTDDLQTLIYADHHAFTKKDISEIIQIFTEIKHNKKLLLTTEKDAVRLADQPGNIPEALKPFLFYIPIEVRFQLNQERLFIQNIEQYVKNFARNSFFSPASDSGRN
ncbi:MAG: tetraacyldisaccharide 4'-kinase [Dysgonamonadaceae bacterium]|nr:tetraacyldisaccharide 4'-kinase [Dysgonamonadaceae bacterium]